MFNFKNPVFIKLYRYYCAKLLKKIWVSIAWLFYFIFIMIMVGRSGKAIKELLNINGWQKTLTAFWVISLVQLNVLWLMVSPFVSQLVGRGLGWEELKKRQLYRIPKISREEDLKVLIFTPNVDRQTVILAKFATIFTYFMAINFILSALLAIGFLLVTNLGVIAVFTFLLLNGLGFGLINFFLIVPFLFYQQEGGSFLVYFLCAVFLVSLFLAIYLLWGFISQYPLVFCLLSIPFYLLAGYSFFSLYQKKFLAKDLD